MPDCTTYTNNPPRGYKHTAYAMLKYMDIFDTLLNGSSDSSSLLDPATLLAPLLPFAVIITIVSVLITVLYVINVITTYRSHRAVIETRNILREMNERDKARSHSPKA